MILFLLLDMFQQVDRHHHPGQCHDREYYQFDRADRHTDPRHIQAHKADGDAQGQKFGQSNRCEQVASGVAAQEQDARKDADRDDEA
jgi:hypothetical protein